jgi:hypothetical protein
MGPIATFALQNGQPLIRELAAHKTNGSWTVLGRDLTPEFSEQQLAPLRGLKLNLTPEVIDHENGMLSGTPRSTSPATAAPTLTCR